MAKPYNAIIEAGAVHEARKLLRELRIQNPDEIDVEAIAGYLGIRIHELPLVGLDGFLMRAKHQSAIVVNQNVWDHGKKRFIIAHELGHFVQHKDARQQHLLSADCLDVMEYRNSRQELEASKFAAELLMPEAMFAPLVVDSQEPSLERIKELSVIFGTSIQAAAIQFVKMTREQCFFIITKDGNVNWMTSSKFMDFRLREKPAIQRHSCIADAHRSATKRARAQNVPAYFWLEGFSSSTKCCITEDSMVLGNSGLAYTLLWIHDEIDPDE